MECLRPFDGYAGAELFRAERSSQTGPPRGRPVSNPLHDSEQRGPGHGISTRLSLTALRPTFEPIQLRLVPVRAVGAPPELPSPFGTREKLTSPARQNFSTNRPRLRCLSDEHGLVALGLAARAKCRCLNLCNDIRAGGSHDEGPSSRHATRHDQFVIWSSLFEHRWSISGGRRGIAHHRVRPARFTRTNNHLRSRSEAGAGETGDWVSRSRTERAAASCAFGSSPRRK